MSEERYYGYVPKEADDDKDNKSKAPRYVMAGGLLLFLIIAGFLIYCQFSISPYGSETRYYELGYFASPYVTDFVEGKDFLYRFVKVDSGDFDYKAAGTYVIKVNYGLRKFVFTAVVEDTQAPVLKLTSKDIYVEKGKGRLDYHDLINEVSDVGSNVVTRPGTCPEHVSLDGNSFVFDEVGEFLVSVDAIDEFGNKTREVMWVTADTAPVITGFPDYYVSTGSSIDFLYNISAHDDVDGDVTASIVYDDSAFNEEMAGEYTVTYTATDNYGLSSSETMIVHVDEALDLQERINRHEIDRHEQVIYGALNLYDCGYPLNETMSMEEIMLQYEPAFVAVTTGVRGGPYSRGSGFIVRIDDEEGWIYIMTNNHVTSSSKHEYNIDFYDGTKIKSELVKRSGKTDVYNDIAIVRVKIEDVPKELMDKLMTVHVDEAYWTGLSDNSRQTVAMLVEEDSVGSRPRKYSEGSLLSKFSTDRSIQTVTSKLVTETSINLYHGCSGSAIIDENGNLISIATATTHMHPDRFWGPTLERILEFFRDSVGVEMNYK